MWFHQSPPFSPFTPFGRAGFRVESSRASKPRGDRTAQDPERRLYARDPRDVGRAVAAAEGLEGEADLWQGPDGFHAIEGMA